MKEETIKYNGVRERLDIYIKKVYPHFSREFIKKIINEKKVKINNRIEKPSYILKEGDVIEISFEDNKNCDFSLSKMIIYEDNDILVINKPPSLLVHPTDDNWTKDIDALSLSKNTVVWLLLKEKKLNEVDGLKRLGLVHRLDAMTSGVMIIAKNSSSQNVLMNQFNERRIEKNYKAVVSGVVKDDFITIDAPIGRFSGSKKLKVMEYGRDAITNIAVIKRGRINSYIDVFPKTGRTNQIRVHLSYIKHPIIGDNIYSKSNFPRLMLHSYKISFTHPRTKKMVSFIAEPDDDFKKKITELL